MESLNGLDRELGVARDKVFYSSPDGKVILINDDYLNTSLKESTVDLVVTSPPYNVDVKYEGYTDNIPYEKYLEFTEKWLRKTRNLLKPDGRICLNIPLDKSKGRDGEGFQSVYADVVGDREEGRTQVLQHDRLERGQHFEKDCLGFLFISLRPLRNSAGGSYSPSLQGQMEERQEREERRDSGGI